MSLAYRRMLVCHVVTCSFFRHRTSLVSNSVNVYDDERKMHVLELCFNSSVVSLRMSRTRLVCMIIIVTVILLTILTDRLVVVLVSRIHILSFPNQCRLLHTIETRDNPRGNKQR
jgi:hypothetical protein